MYEEYWILPVLPLWDDEHVIHKYDSSLLIVNHGQHTMPDKMHSK